MSVLPNQTVRPRQGRAPMPIASSAACIVRSISCPRLSSSRPNSTLMRTRSLGKVSRGMNSIRIRQGFDGVAVRNRAWSNF